jgi:hypothetical protein
MPALSTPEAPPENEQEDNSGANRLPRSPEQQHPIAPEARGSDGATTEISEAQRKKMMEEMQREQPESAPSAPAGDTPWQSARNWTRSPLKKATKVGLFVLNPVVYSSIYAADWMAQRTPGVKRLYGAPREIIRSTADKTMNVLNGAATFGPALPFNVAHEVSDKMSGMDLSKPTTLLGKLTDNAGDVIGGSLNILKSIISKTVEVGKKVVPEVGKGIAALVTSPFKMIGAIYSGINKIGGATGLVGNLLFTLFLATTGHAAISAVLGATSPVLAATYGGAVDTAIQTIRGLIPWL